MRLNLGFSAGGHFDPQRKSSRAQMYFWRPHCGEESALGTKQAEARDAVKCPGIPRIAFDNEESVHRKCE